MERWSEDEKSYWNMNEKNEDSVNPYEMRNSYNMQLNENKEDNKE